MNKEIISTKNLYIKSNIVKSRFILICRHKSLQASKSKLSSTTEAGLLGAMALLQHLLPLLSDTAFMNSLQKRLIEGAVYPVIRLLTSTKVTFPHGAPVRAALSYRVVDILFVMALRWVEKLQNTESRWYSIRWYSMTFYSLIFYLSWHYGE